MTTPRQPAQLVEDPTICPLTRFPITIMHPSYENVPLIAFDALARASNGGWGVNHQLALDACSILSQNRSGFLSSTSSRNNRIDNTVPVLTARCYYYHLWSEERAYPIVTLFDAWKPAEPPGHWNTAVSTSRANIPASPLWQSATPSHMSENVKADDHSTCLISRYPCRVQNAHLVPREHEAWFVHHSQFNYNVSPDVLSAQDGSNGISLRADLHIGLDSSDFVFIPLGNKVVVYYLVQKTVYTSLYHATEIIFPARLSINHLYSRFAYNIIKRSSQASMKVSRAQLVQVPAELQQLKKDLKQSKGAGFSRHSSSLPSVSEAEEHLGADVPMDRADADSPCSNVAVSKWLETHPPIRQMEHLKTWTENLQLSSELSNSAEGDTLVSSESAFSKDAETDFTTGHSFLHALRLPVLNSRSKSQDWLSGSEQAKEDIERLSDS